MRSGKGSPNPSLRSGRRDPSPLWNRALERYREELSENESYDDILGDTGSLQDVLEHIKTFEPQISHDRAKLVSFNRLGPMLKFVDDFSAVIALFFGANARLTAFVWGSIRLILSLAVAANENLQSILDMLEELSVTLPEFRSYEDDLPMAKPLEVALLDLYTEVICFYARTIHFFKSNPHVSLQRKAWGDFQGDFSRTIRSIRRMSSKVKAEADLARMSMNKDRYKEVIDLVQDLEKAKVEEESSARCFLVPHDPDPRLSGRQEAIDAAAQVLEPSSDKGGEIRSFALYGMGGVGKTQVALLYAKKFRDHYDAVIWIAADTSYAMGQTCRDAAEALELITRESELKDMNSAISKLRTWLQNTYSRWLLILDNADDVSIISQLWPVGAKGSILVTSRDFNTAHNPANAGYHMKPFQDEVGAQVFLTLLGYNDANKETMDLALNITQMLGGLPLALNQIASFITQRQMRLRDFPVMYEKHSAAIDAKKSRLTTYEKTLATTWDISLSRLSGDAIHLQSLLALLDPDTIHEEMLTSGALAVSESELAFLGDEFELGEAEESLLQAALLEKSRVDQTLSVHRLVQAAIIRRMSEAERVKYFDAAVTILHRHLTDEWSTETGYELKAWSSEGWIRHERCVRHMANLMRQSKRYAIVTKRKDVLIAALIPCALFLKEREFYQGAQELLNAAKGLIDNKETLAYARIVNVSGLISLNLNEANESIEPFQQALAIREALLGPDDTLTAWVYNNLGLAYTELNDFPKALENHEKAVEMRHRNQDGLIGNSYSNFSSLYLKMGEPNRAEKYLFDCPSLQNCTDETFLNKNNPRFAGDMVLLSRIRRAQARPEDALRLASKALSYRKQLLGNGFAVCDSLYDVASLLDESGNQGAAALMLNDIVSIAEGLPGGHSYAHRARASYKLSTIYGAIGRKTEGEACKATAIQLRLKLRPEEVEADLGEESFSKLCPWMLW